MGQDIKQKSIKRLRYIIQVFFVILVIYLLVNYLPSRNFMLTVLALLLLMTLVFRTGFCGWICPLGAVDDLLRVLGKKIGIIPFIKPVNKKYRKWVKNNKPLLNKIDKYARVLKYLFLLWILQAAFLSIASIKKGNEHGIITVIYLVIALLTLSLFIDRAWCRYACPLGAIIGIFGRLSPTKIIRDEELCINCNKCTRSCPMNIDVANVKQVNTLDCNTCLNCVDVCPVEGALDLIINPLPVKEKQPQIKDESEGQAVK